jgi:alkaline phosphatase D
MAWRSSLTRRSFVLSAGGLLLLRSSLGRGAPGRYPFTLGVASGSPRETSVVLWTRLAPLPLEGGGMAASDVKVRFRVCSDPTMSRTVRDGTAVARSASAHAVHVKIDGLQQDREYWYQFHVGEDDSAVGRTRTARSKRADVNLAIVNCQHFETGHYAAYGDIVRWAPDCVVHIGDYIYEGAASPPGRTVRRHLGGECRALGEYRNRYALYKLDPLLQAAHATSPWIAALDDHDVASNWAGDVPEDPDVESPDVFRLRKQAAFQAYYEHLPLARPVRLGRSGAQLPLYDRFRFGPAQIHLLDTRQYRSDQVCGDAFPASVPCDDLKDPARTMTGLAQERWLLRELESSSAKYNVIAQQVWFSPYRYRDAAGTLTRQMDQWDGYPVQRQRLIDALARGVSRPIVLSGDFHCGAAMEIHADVEDPRSAVIGHEFAATSISSRCRWADALDKARGENPHALYVDGHKRGYLRCTATADAWTTQYRVVDDPMDAASALTTDREFRIG